MAAATASAQRGLHYRGRCAGREIQTLKHQSLPRAAPVRRPSPIDQEVAATTVLQALADCGGGPRGLSLTTFADWCASVRAPPAQPHALVPWLTPGVFAAITGLHERPFSDVLRAVAGLSDDEGLLSRNAFNALWRALTPAPLERAFGPQRASATAALFDLLADPQARGIDFVVLAASLAPLCGESTPRRLASLWHAFDASSLGGLSRPQLEELLAGVLRAHALFDPDARGSLAAAALVAGVAPAAIPVALEAWLTAAGEGAGGAGGGETDDSAPAQLPGLLARIATQLAQGLASAAFAASATPRATVLPLVAFLAWLLDVRLPLLDVSGGAPPPLPSQAASGAPPRSRSAPGHGRHAGRPGRKVGSSGNGGSAAAWEADIPAPFRGVPALPATPEVALRVKRERSWADASILDNSAGGADALTDDAAVEPEWGGEQAGAGASSPSARPPLRKRLETEAARGASAPRETTDASAAPPVAAPLERPVLLPQFSRPPVFDAAIGARSARKQGGAGAAGSGSTPAPRSRSAPAHGQRASSRGSSPPGGGRSSQPPSAAPSVAPVGAAAAPPRSARSADAASVIEVVRALAELQSAPGERVVGLFVAHADAVPPGSGEGSRPTALSRDAFLGAYDELLSQQVRRGVCAEPSWLRSVPLFCSLPSVPPPQSVNSAQQIAATALGPALFGALDRDRDGVISAPELAAGLLALCDGERLARSTPLFALFGGGSDGRLTRSELAAFLATAHRPLFQVAAQGDPDAVARRAAAAAANVPGGADNRVSHADFEAWLEQTPALVSARAETPDGASTPPVDQPTARKLEVNAPATLVGTLPASPRAVAPTALRVPPLSRMGTQPLLSPHVGAPDALQPPQQQQQQEPAALFSARPAPPVSPLTLLFSLHSRPAAEVIEDFAAVVGDESLLPRSAFVRRMLRYLQPTVVRGSGFVTTARPDPGSEAASSDADVLAVVDPAFVVPVQRVLDDLFVAFRAAEDDSGSPSIDFVDFAAGLTAVTDGSAGERMAVAFHLLDADGDGLLSRGELRLLLSALLRMGGIKAPSPEGPHARDRYDELAAATCAEAFAFLARSGVGADPAAISLAQFKEWYSRPSQTRAHAAARRSIVHADPATVAAAAAASARHAAAGGDAAAEASTENASAVDPSAASTTTGTAVESSDDDVPAVGGSTLGGGEAVPRAAPWRNLAHLHDLLGLSARSLPSVLRHFSRYQDEALRISLPRFRSAVASLTRSASSGGAPGVSTGALADALFAAFSSYGSMGGGRGGAAGGDEPLGLTALVTGLSALMGGEHDARVASSFHLFDADGDGYLSQADLRTYLRSVMPALLRTSEAARAVARASNAKASHDVIASTLARRAIDEADSDCDGKLSIHEFAEVSAPRPPALCAPFHDCLHVCPLSAPVDDASAPRDELAPCPRGGDSAPGVAHRDRPPRRCRARPAVCGLR